MYRVIENTNMIPAHKDRIPITRVWEKYESVERILGYQKKSQNKTRKGADREAGI